MTVPIVFDRRTYAARRGRAARSAGDQFLVHQIAESMAERLGAVKKSFSQGLDLGSRSASFARLAQYAGYWVRTGLSPADEAVSLVADEEALPFAGRSFDLVVSVLSLHAVNDLPGALLQIRRALKPDGLFLASLFGGATLGELRRAFAAGEVEQRGGASPRVAPFGDVRDMGQLLQRAGFTQPVADLDRIVVRYTSFATIVKDLRALGETNSLVSRDRSPLRRDVLRAALAHYASRDADDQGKLTATFDIVSLTGWSAGPD
ncbi:MAG TPA: methyltransferase domain-containing protein [Rhizomicrobium sp.]|jgi:SAM-dependent methyltransferase|nr:methyltransferase domain-containing protein [Rhizomicrobium sp.]